MLPQVLAHGDVSGVWTWRPHPDVWLVMGGILALYALAVRFWGRSHVSIGDPAVTNSQVRLFALGVLVMWIAADWPMHEISEGYLFSFHMLQHMAFSLIAPPLLLLGTPDWMARKLLSPKPVMAVMKRLTRPLPALIAFNAFLVFSHWPTFVDATLRNGALHLSAHTVLVGLSLLMWWPVFSPISELPRISPPAQMLYMFGQTIVPTVPASFLTFAESPFYRVYAEAPRLFAALDPVTDQRVAGLVMKVGGGFLLWAIITVLFFRWSASEETGSPDASEWQEIELEINQHNPRVSHD